MNMVKIAGIFVVGVGLAALVGGGIWYWRRRKKQQDAGTPENVPSKPSNPEDVPASETQPRGHMAGEPDLRAELRKELGKIFGESWGRPDEQTINELQRDDVVVFAAESEPVGNYTETQQELVTAKVLSVDAAAVHARVLAPVEHAEHHGSHAGHGYRVGDLVDVPRSKVLVAARRNDTDKTGYGSQGEPAATFKPSDTTKQTYKVRPGTPYDLILPYRTGELAWYLDRKLVNLVHIGEDGLIEQIMFSEDSLRGDVSVRLLDEDPELGAVFVARWDFELDA